MNETKEMEIVGTDDVQHTESPRPPTNKVSSKNGILPILEPSNNFDYKQFGCSIQSEDLGFYPTDPNKDEEI